MKRPIVVVLLILSMNSSFGFIFGSFGTQQRIFSYTHNKPALTNLYNQGISSVQEYRRPLNIKYGAGLLNAIGLNHRGQVATMKIKCRTCGNHRVQSCDQGVKA